VTLHTTTLMGTGVLLTEDARIRTDSTSQISQSGHTNTRGKCLSHLQFQRRYPYSYSLQSLSPVKGHFSTHHLQHHMLSPKMKLILTGSTGFIGHEVLSQALSHPSITSVIALTRQPLPSSTSNPKLQILLVEDFSNYTPSLLRQLAGAGACIWYSSPLSPPPSHILHENSERKRDRERLTNTKGP
jgi:hypothetical protein